MLFSMTFQAWKMVLLNSMTRGHVANCHIYNIEITALSHNYMQSSNVLTGRVKGHFRNLVSRICCLIFVSRFSSIFSRSISSAIAASCSSCCSRASFWRCDWQQQHTENYTAMHMHYAYAQILHRKEIISLNKLIGWLSDVINIIESRNKIEKVWSRFNYINKEIIRFKCFFSPKTG